MTLYERGAPGNGQSGGESRIFRHAHDDRRLVAFACDARAMWREWEEWFGEELLARDGVVAVGPAAVRRLAVMLEAGGVRAGEVEASELAGWLPLLAPPDAPVVVDEDGGVIHARATIDALTEAVRDSLVVDEVISVRLVDSGAVEVRAGGVHAEHERVVLCAGRGTVALARGAGLPLPVRQAAHARLTYRIRGQPSARLACLLDGGGAYGDPLPGNAAYAVGLGETAVHEDGSLVDPRELANAGRADERLRRRGAPRPRAGADRRPPLLGHRAALEPGRHRRLGARRPARGRRQQPLQARPRARSCARARGARRRPRAEPAARGQARRRRPERPARNVNDGIEGGTERA